MALLEVKGIKKAFYRLAPASNEKKMSGIKKGLIRTPVLNGIDFSLEEGEVLSIIGASGNGKTTLLRCLNFLESADEGQIFVDGKLIFDASDKRKLSRSELLERQLNFGMVFQGYNLFPQYTVFENVCLAGKLRLKSEKRLGKKSPEYAEIEDRARELLARVGLSEKLDDYPCHLSGGQQQRVAIARALAQNPRILCFDEPTSALDPELTGEVLKVIRSLADQHTTMIIVTHEMSFARGVSDNVIFMDDGYVVEYGSPESLFDHPKTDRLRAFLNANKQ